MRLKGVVGQRRPKDQEPEAGPDDYLMKSLAFNFRRPSW